MTLWINVTSSYKWRNHNPVGIIRVERECLKFFLNNKINNLNVRFFIYDNLNKIFREISNFQIKEYLYAFSPAVVKSDRIENAVSFTTNNKLKHKVKCFFKKSINSLPKLFQPTILNLALYLRKIYKLLILVPLFYIRFFKVDLTSKLKLFTENNFKKRNINELEKFKEVSFERNSLLLTLGLDWDHLNIKKVFELKHQLNLKTVFFCYDTIPILFPQYCLEDVSNHFSHYFIDIAWTADHIICISKCTRNDLESFYKDSGAPVPKMSVITLGSDIIDRKSTKSNNFSSKISNITNEDFILYVSTIEKRKNHEILYKAYSYLSRNKQKRLPKLVFVGMVGWGVNELIRDIYNDPYVKDKIIIINDLSDLDLAILYNKSLFTVYPSVYEGWGLPVAESLNNCKFALVSDSSSLREVGKEFVEYIKPWDVYKWADRISFYSNPANKKILQKKESIIKKAYTRVTWYDTSLAISKIVLKIN